MLILRSRRGVLGVGVCLPACTGCICNNYGSRAGGTSFYNTRWKNKWILLHELRQAFLEVFVIYETEMPRVNVVKSVQREGIKLCANFLWMGMFSRASGKFKGGVRGGAWGGEDFMGPCQGIVYPTLISPTLTLEMFYVLVCPTQSWFNEYMLVLWSLWIVMGFDRVVSRRM